jgi:hypothetical protein
MSWKLTIAGSRTVDRRFGSSADVASAAVRGSYDGSGAGSVTERNGSDELGSGAS